MTVQFQTFAESRLDAINCFSVMFNCSKDYAAEEIDKIVENLRNECQKQNKPNATHKIKGETYSFKIDATYLTFD